MQTTRLNLGLTKLALVFSVAFAAASISANAAALTIYNGQHRSATQALVDGFTAKTGIEVDIRDGKSNELAHQIVEEGKKSPADIIYTEESSPLVMLANKNLLANIDAKTLENIPAAYRDQANKWTGVLGRSRVVIYNPDMISPADLPKSVKDLTDDSWKGKFAYVPTSGAFQMQLSAMIKLDGRESAKNWLEGLKKNGKIYRKNSVVLDAVDRGDIAFGLINNYYWDRQAKEKGKENLKSRLYFFGTHDLGDMLTIASMGILDSSANKEDAQKFIAYTVSPEGQQILTDVSAQYPLNQNVVSHPDLKPFSELTPPEGTFDLGEYSDGKAAVELLQETGLL